MPVTGRQTSEHKALRALLAHAIDYAGLYPPALLSMDAAVQEYAKQRASLDAWALGRFVVGMDQLGAFVAARRSFANARGQWPISTLVTRNDGPHGRDVSGDVDVLRVEAIEAKASSPAEVQALEWMTALAPELYVEFSPDAELEPLLRAVRTLGARAKIRTGGVIPSAIPAAEAVARFMRACVDADVPFKATAGLHHMIRGEYALTYEPDSPRAVMFGFLNVFVAAALAVDGMPVRTLIEVLEERRLRAFRLDGGTSGVLCWREHCLTQDQLHSARDRALTGFGSCSFAEPVAELARAGWAPSE